MSFVYTPQNVAIASTAKDAQTRLREMAGLSNTPADWQYKDRQEYNNALAAEYAAHPEVYGKNAEIAAKYKPTSLDLEQYGFFDMAGDFGSEFVNQGQAINPFSEQNRSKSSNGLLLGIVAVIVVGVAYILFSVKKA